MCIHIVEYMTGAIAKGMLEFFLTTVVGRKRYRRYFSMSKWIWDKFDNMKTLAIQSICLLLFCAFCAKGFAQDTSAAYWTPARAQKWFNSGEWKKGLPMAPHSSVNVVAFAIQYHKNHVLWDKVFDFLRSTDFNSIAPGRYVIDGDKAFAIITEGPTKPMEDTKWESHRQYIDLHYVIRGQEQIGVAAMSHATLTEPFTDKSDNAHYNAEGTFFVAGPGTFFLFFPQDVHKAGISTDPGSTDKKMVIKISVAQ
jgi:biofilm protein TabA